MHRLGGTREKINETNVVDTFFILNLTAEFSWNRCSHMVATQSRLKQREHDNYVVGS